MDITSLDLDLEEEEREREKEKWETGKNNNNIFHQEQIDHNGYTNGREIKKTETSIKMLTQPVTGNNNKKNIERKKTYENDRC